jgi:penicillin G amidase
LKIQELRAAVLALWWVGPVAAQTATSAQWQPKAEAAVAEIRGTVEIPGLKEAVRVQRDRWGVPHIYAGNSHDLFFAQGFVVAQDRLFQMELWKRSGQGRLAEVLGPEAVARDLNARRLRYRGDMEAEYRSYAPDARAILEAFTAGINAYIAEIEKPGGHGLPVEFQIAGFKPEIWHAEDCLNRMAAYSMTGNAASELKHAQLVALLGADRATTLFDFDPAVKLDPSPGFDFSGLSPAVLKNLIGSDVRIPFDPNVLHESNNWTVSGALTVSGRPLLANDPHRVLAEPSLRYVVHLVAPGWNVIGAGEPGLPGVAAGHNEQIGWGFTIFGLDQQDLYVETLNPADPLEYATPGGWERMTVVRESIAVRGAPAVQVELKFTRHGPVLWEEGARALALRWVGAEPGSAGYLGALALDRARNWTEFEAAMPRWKVPSENIVYADREGNIGEHSTGLAPLRENWTGLLPVPGKGGYEWAGFIPNEKLPHSYNPAAGFVATANHKMIPDGYPYAVGFEWAEPVRYLRIKEVLDGAKARGGKLGVPDMEALQTDVVSLLARDLQRLLQEAVDREGTAGDDSHRFIVQLLLQWDCALRADSPEATVYEFWAAELRSAVTARAVPGEAQKIIGKLSLLRVVKELSNPQNAIFGDDPRSARDAMLLATLETARLKLSARQGPDIKGWAWGQLHHIKFQHPLDSAPGAGALFDRGPMKRSGDGEVVQATGYRDDSFDQLSGASYREIFDLADWDRSVGINVPGQSGQPQAKHYDDLLPLWIEGKYFPLSFTKGAVDAVTTDVLYLTPAHKLTPAHELTPANKAYP